MRRSLEVEPPDHQVPATPVEGPELKYRFGRYIERAAGVRIFQHEL
jgi:hypothetical protein